ncbi:MAG: restriction endonuclease subunit S, partial [Ferruginibacter sp.]
MKWEKREMGDLIDLYDNLRIPLSAIEREKKQGEYPYYGAQSIIDYVNEYLFDGDYILIAEDGENLRTRTQPIAFAVSGQFWVNNHAHIVKGKDNIADDLFIKYYLNNLDINPYVTGAAQPKLSQRNLKAIIVDTPSLPTQRKIASILSAYDDLIENNLKRIKLL